jgi:hypothetical protein
MHVESDVPLPVAPVSPAVPCVPTWVIRRAGAATPCPPPPGPAVGAIRCCHSTVQAVCYAGESGDLIWQRAVGAFHIAPDARRVDVYPDSGVDPDLLGLALAGLVAVFVLRKLGYPCLHASAVTTGKGTVAFLGPHGQGKSTMAACFLRRGATLVTDDALPLRSLADGVYAGPGVPMMKLWRDSADCSLHLSGELPNLTPAVEKKRVALEGRYPFAQEPRRLQRIYVLDRYDPGSAGRTDVTLQALRPRDGVAALLGHTSGSAFIQPIEAARLLPLYTRLVAQSPVSVVRFPDGYEYQESVYQALMTDLEGA